MGYRKSPTWQSYTPVLTASSVNPVLGSGSAIYGSYLKVGDDVVVRFGIRFGTSGHSKGSGLYSVSLPIAMRQGASVAGFTSDVAGAGLLWRGQNGFDVGMGAHLPIQWQISGPTSAVGVVSPGAQGGQLEEGLKTSYEDVAGASAAFTDITSCSVSYVPLRSGARLRIVADLQVYKISGSTGDVLAQITDLSGNVLRRRSATTGVFGSGFGNGLYPLRVEYIHQVQTASVGQSHGFKVQVKCLDGSCGVFGSGEVPSSITLEELAGSSTSGLTELTDYLSDSVPWTWGNENTGGAEIWGYVIGEAL